MSIVAVTRTGLRWRCSAPPRLRPQGGRRALSRQADTFLSLRCSAPERWEPAGGFGSSEGRYTEGEEDVGGGVHGGGRTRERGEEDNSKGSSQQLQPPYHLPPRKKKKGHSCTFLPAAAAGHHIPISPAAAATPNADTPVASSRRSSPSFLGHAQPPLAALVAATQPLPSPNLPSSSPRQRSTIAVVAFLSSSTIATSSLSTLPCLLSPLPQPLSVGHTPTATTTAHWRTALLATAAFSSVAASAISTIDVLAFLQNFREKEKRIVDDTRSTFNQQSTVLWNEPRAPIYND
ncbi:hypothetical protein BHM03_00002395 [Ensete ventricosum]|nr:hypothetical protein BHM03_00002395 [Ensete ventricosum]